MVKTHLKFYTRIYLETVRKMQKSQAGVYFSQDLNQASSECKFGAFTLQPVGFCKLSDILHLITKDR